MCNRFVWIQLVLHLCLSQRYTQAKETGGQWSEWGPMSHCSVTCGLGVMEKRRVWIQDPADKVKSSEPWTSTQSVSCVNDKYPICPVDGKWSEWSGWNMCTKACGGGIRHRDRECFDPKYGGKKCEGFKQENEDCNKDPCPGLPKKFDLSQCRESYNYTCESKKMCIPSFQKCDGTVQCHDGSDEMKCPLFQGQPGYIFYDLKMRNGVLSKFFISSFSSGLLLLISFCLLHLQI